MLRQVVEAEDAGVATAILRRDVLDDRLGAHRAGP